MERRIEQIKKLVPLKEFTLGFAAQQLNHIDNDKWLYEAGRKRLICSLLGTLHEELSDRPDLQDIVLEIVWMARRMNDSKLGQTEMWNT